MPIVETLLSDVAVELAGQAQSQQLQSQCSVRLHVDVYNNALMGWEPLLEPWNSSLTLIMPLIRYTGHHYSSYTQKQSESSLSVTQHHNKCHIDRD